MATILDDIVAHKRLEIEQRRMHTPAAMLEKRLPNASPVRDFTRALHRPGTMQLIAEIKRTSPSAGVMREQVDPVAMGKVYEQHGAAAISVLTDEKFFQGSLDDLSRVRSAVSLPVLRKDFILDPYQILEARAAGADAILLIAEILDESELRSLLHEAKEYGLHVLVEFYDAVNLNRVVNSDAKLIGINNRDLRTFVTRLDHTMELASRIPRDRCLVSESGIKSREDVIKLESAGVGAILVGETLMRAADPGRQIELLRGTHA